MKDENKQGQPERKWFAVRAITDRPYVQKYLAMYGYEVSRIEALPSLFFIHTQLATLQSIRYGDLAGHLLVYRKPGSYEPDPVPESSVKTLQIMAPFKGEDVRYLAVDDPGFFEGRRKRVIKGVFAGCEGVIKRIKGERRLVVKISERAAIATAYIPKEYLEDVK